MPKRPDSQVRSGSKLPTTLRYVHPVDLLKASLFDVSCEASHLVDLTLDNYELGYVKLNEEIGWRFTPTLRKDHYSTPEQCRERYSAARRALELALPAAVGISEWLRWGMGERAGTFETELREALAALKLLVHDFPALPLYPILKEQCARWKRLLAKVATLAGELDSVAIESRNPAEWQQALRGALGEIRTLFDAFCAYYVAARNIEADLTADYDRLNAAIAPVQHRLLRLGARLSYAMDDDADTSSSLVDRFSHVMTQCRGNLYDWRATKIRHGDELPTLPPDFDRAWDFVEWLGDSVFQILGGRAAPLSAPKRRSRRKKHCVPKADQAAFERSRENAIEEKIRQLARDGMRISSRAVAAKCTGRDGSGIPEGTIRCSEAWKRRDEIIAEVARDSSDLDRYRNAGAFNSDNLQFDEIEPHPET